MGRHCGKEIDAIIRVDKKYIGVEIKYQAQVDTRDIRQIAPVKDYIILSKEDLETEGNVLVVPVDVFLSLLVVSERNV